MNRTQSSGRPIGKSRNEPFAPLALWLSVLALAIMVTFYSAHLSDAPKAREAIPNLNQTTPPSGNTFPALDDIEIENLA